MKKKIITTLLVFALVGAALSASNLYVGIESGYSYALVHSNTGWSNTYERDAFGFDITVPVEYKVTNWFSINSGVRFQMKSSLYEKYATIGYQSPNLIDKYRKMHYVLDFPVMARFSLSNEIFSAFIGGGAYVGVRLFDMLSGQTDNMSSLDFCFTEFQALSSDANYFDAGLIAEAGFTISPSDAGYFYMLVRYQYGLTSLSRAYKMAAHTYFDNISLSMGYMFNI